jgi:soluble lytic murein transglycosylase
MRRTQLIVAALLLFPCGLLAAADRGGDAGRVQPEAAARMPPDRWAEERALFIRLRPQAEMGRWSNVEPHLAELGDYRLVPDLRAAWLHRRLGAGTDSELARFLRRYDNLGFTRGLRLRWARSLAARKEWERYLSVYDSYLVERDDTELDCYALQGRLATGPDDALVEDALVFWLSAYSQPKACDPLFDYLAEVDAITPAIRHERITLALEAGQVSLARYLARPLPDTERQRIEAWARMQRDPERSLRDPSAFDDSADDQRLVAYGLKRLARRDPRKADARLAEYRDRVLTAEQAAAVERDVALTAARRYMPEARGFLGDPVYGEDTLVTQWRIRLALRDTDWAEALDALAALPEAERDEDHWRYWWAWSMAETGREGEAEPLLKELAGERHYYGFLAADRLEVDYAFGHAPAKPDEEMIAELARRPEIARTRELYLTGLFGRGRLEWSAAMKDLDEDERVQASILAHRWGWHSRAIRTASRYGLENDLELRFPLPWQEDFQRLSKRVSIDPTWAYGVARSESLFMPDVASHAGAIGLMQLMPATGKETARKNNIRYDNRYSLMDPAKNIALGTSYLAEMLARFDNNRVLATAAYNAGPHRVTRWQPDYDGMPATVWAESIPFKETREYVRRVLAAETVFAWRMNGNAERLSDSMPPVPRRRSGT